MIAMGCGRRPGPRPRRPGVGDWFDRWVEPHVDGVREPVTGKGQLQLAGPAGCGLKAFADDWQYLADEGQKPRSSFPVFEE